MFRWVTDPYDTLPTWWEMDCVKYGLSYTPVSSRLMTVMGSHIIRLSDRKYMMHLTSKLQEDYEAQQKIRIEKRKLKPSVVLPDLHPLVESLLKKVPRQRHKCAPKIHAVAAIKCRQLPQLLLADNSEFHKDT